MMTHKDFNGLCCQGPLTCLWKQQQVTLTINTTSSWLKRLAYSESECEVREDLLTGKRSMTGMHKLTIWKLEFERRGFRT